MSSVLMQQLCMSMRVAMHLGTYATAMHEHAWSFTRSSNTPFVMHLCNSYCMHELACVLHCMIGLYACVCIFIYILCVCVDLYMYVCISRLNPQSSWPACMPSACPPKDGNALTKRLQAFRRLKARSSCPRTSRTLQPGTQGSWLRWPSTIPG